MTYVLFEMGEKLLFLTRFRPASGRPLIEIPLATILLNLTGSSGR
jgi:hypothetical protein